MTEITLQNDVYTQVRDILQTIADSDPRELDLTEGADTTDTNTVIALIGLAADVEPDEDGGGLEDQYWVEDFSIGIEVATSRNDTLSVLRTYLYGLAQTIADAFDADQALQDLTERCHLTVIGYTPGTGTTSGLPALGLELIVRTRP